ncbi:hypothetical protein [Methanosarcina sp. UBA5]|uniref:hypothetical protein n=1 Tax=Methanosarcina sp. UBA5 TaxID=1915593 RepID=UPI0025E5FFB0|nr:hypothetical protein [Methanosarcina sp. UBA5]
MKLAGRQLKLAQDTFREAQREWNTYVDKTSGGAQKAITTLEYTRDVSFSIAIGTAAVVAAPAVAGALAGGGTITAGAVLGSGAIVTTGGGITGAALRGGSSAAGQALTGGPISGTEVWKEMKAGAKSGTVDAASSVVGFGAGKALGLGTKGVSLGGKLIRGGLAGGASGATGGALGSTLEGKSASEILEDTGKGAFSGMAGGAIGSAASHISTGRSTISKYVIETLGEVGSGAASAAVTGGSLEDIKKAAITSVVSGMATSAATHPGPKITRGTESALELDPGTQPASPSVSNPVKTPAFTKEPEPFKVSHEAAPPKAASSKGNESHTVKSKLPEPIKTEIPPPKKKSNRSKSAKSKREAEYLKEKKQLSQQAIEEGAIERESRIDERSEKAKRKSRDIERRQARLREQGQNEAEQSPTPKFDFTDAEFNEGFSLVAEKPGVQVPVNKTGDPAKVLEVGAGLKQTDLGLPPNEELVNVTQSDKNPSRSNVMELDAEKPLPPEMNGEYDSIMINNPRRYVPNIEKLGKALKPGGRIIVQGKGEVFKGMRGANPDFEKVLKMPAPLGYKKIIDLSPSGSAPITPDQILGGPFYSTTGEPIGWPNGRVIFGKLPEGPFAKEAITATGKTKVLASGTEVTGEGKALAEGGKAAAAYDDIDLTSLRQAARTDPEAVEALRLRYKNMSDFELFQRFADDADETAAAIIRQKFPSNEAALKKILGKDYRPPHSATAVLRRGGRVVRYEKLESGHVADLPAEERALGFPRNRLATHTERWAIRRIDLHPGDSLEIRGQYDPCDSCIKAMSEAATRTRATIKYWWQGGSMTFFPN